MKLMTECDSVLNLNGKIKKPQRIKDNYKIETKVINDKLSRFYIVKVDNREVPTI